MRRPDCGISKDASPTSFLCPYPKYSLMPKSGERVGKKLKIMNAKLEQAVKLFMDNLEVVNELHNQNDYNRLYNIALIASVNNENIPYDKMKEEFNNAIDERNLNRTRLDAAYPEYIHTLTIAYDVINRMKNKQIIIPENFKF